MPQPLPLQQAIDIASAVAAGAPVLVHLLLVAALVGDGVSLLSGRAPAQPALAWGALSLLAVIWMLGQGAGTLSSGMATDPNAVPALALLLGRDLAGRWATGGSSPAPDRADAHRR